jgi:hypothetical protein
MGMVTIKRTLRIGADYNSRERRTLASARQLRVAKYLPVLFRRL